MGIVFYTNFLVPKTAAGCARGIFILIRPQYKDDIGLLAHERVHVKQYVRSFGLSGILYKLSKKHRYKYELEAFKRQVAVSGSHTADHLASRLAENYGLDITKEQALEAILG